MCMCVCVENALGCISIEYYASSTDVPGTMMAIAVAVV